MLAVVEPIHPRHHGDHSVEHSYLIDTTYSGQQLSQAMSRNKWLRNQWNQVTPKQPHPRVRAFWTIAERCNVELIEQQNGDDGEAYAVLKTFWLRLVQRRWRKLLEQKRARLVELSSVKAQRYYQIHGQVMPSTLPISTWWTTRLPWMK